MFEVGQQVTVTQIDSAHGVIDPAGEEGVITFAGRVNDADHAGQMVYVEWVTRPLRHQRNGSFRPHSQMWLDES